MNMINFAIVLVVIWLLVNLKYIGVTKNDFTDWWFLHKPKRRPTKRAADFCPDCLGQGYMPAGTTANRRCDTCHGTGKTR